MIQKLFAAWCLLGSSVAIHAAGLALLLRMAAVLERRAQRFWPVTWMLIQFAGCLIFIHLLEIAVWALFFWWQGCLPDAESSFYFSGVTYTTVGYGDLVLPAEWRLLGPVEGLTGILMCGLSTGFFFVVVSRIVAEWRRQSQSGRTGDDP